MDQYKIKDAVIKLNRINIDEYKVSKASCPSGVSKSSKPNNQASTCMKHFLREIIEKSKEFQPPCDIVDLTNQQVSFKFEQVQLRRATDRKLPPLPPPKKTSWDEFHDQIKKKLHLGR